jgi:hypothetical protein
LEFASVAVQVLVMTLLLPITAEITSEYPIVGVAQLSVAVAGPLVAAGKILAEQAMVKFAGDKVKVGAVVSVRVMV